MILLLRKKKLNYLNFFSHFYFFLKKKALNFFLMKKIYVEYKNDSYEFDLSIKLDDFKNQITERFPQLKMNKFEIVFYNQNNYQILQESNYKLLYNNYRCYKVKINEEKDLKRSQVYQSKILDDCFPNKKKK